LHDGLWKSVNVREAFATDEKELGSERMTKPQTALKRGVRFLRSRIWTVSAISVVLLIPCWWHRRIEAGDLASHVYNAWLAQLIEKGQAPGLYLSKQWNNVLFDVALLKCANLVGLPAAEKIVVSACVLIFFWGAFAFVAAVTQRTPWLLVPGLAMLAYGWTFNIGFFNYYLSLGLSFFAIALFCEGRRADFVAACALGVLVLVAHPQGFVWLIGCVSYVTLWRVLRGRTKLLLPASAVCATVVVRVYLSHHYETYGVWDSLGPGIYLGHDQLALHSMRYYALSEVAAVFGLACFVADAVRRQKNRQSWWEPLRLPFELYAVVVFATYLLPDVMRLPLYSGWIGASAVRLTTISAVLGLCVLAFMQPKKWHAIGFALVAVPFFLFLYEDTAVLNRMELQAERLVSGLPFGQKVTTTIWAPPDSRLPYIAHIVDRACVGRCFSYENYEPSSGEFRVRVRTGSPIAADDPDASEAMQAGEYVVQAGDLPMMHIYQCDERDLTKLCMRALAAGEPNGKVGYHPPK
jgi:hypothetical protein